MSLAAKQTNTVKYDADHEIMNIYENLQIVRSQFFTDILLFSLLQIFIGLSVFWFVAYEYKQIAIRLLLTILHIQSAIIWATMKVILKYTLLPSLSKS